MRLSPIMLEEYTGRSVELRHDHPLGTVDNERAGIRHERNFAHINFLLLHLFHRVGAGRLAIHDDELHARSQRRRVSEPALLALLYVEWRMAEGIAHEFQPRVPGMADDRENRRERGLKPLILAFTRRHISLQKRGVGLKLSRQ
jgi:hypothetical protein